MTVGGNSDQSRMWRNRHTHLTFCALAKHSWKPESKAVGYNFSIVASQITPKHKAWNNKHLLIPSSFCGSGIWKQLILVLPAPGLKWGCSQDVSFLKACPEWKGASHGQRSLVGYGPQGHRVGHKWSDLAYTYTQHTGVEDLFPRWLI